LQILSILEDALESGQSPEELCADRPELLGEVRACLGRVERIRGELDAWFPGPGATGTGPFTGVRPAELGLPRIPGHEVEAVLGLGGMGVVYWARHLRLNRTVAVKMMLAGGYASPPERTRFLREAEATASLGHPNIVQVIGRRRTDSRVARFGPTTPTHSPVLPLAVW
jgi:eukaryotic-like serine/threonine-protein kinase